MTRAKSLLIVIGNGNILALDKSWKAWINDCVDKECVVGMNSELEKSLVGVIKKKDLDCDDEYFDDFVAEGKDGWKLSIYD
jgi:superfamily I DNA and/or RNA helicase